MQNSFAFTAFFHQNEFIFRIDIPSELSIISIENKKRKGYGMKKSFWSKALNFAFLNLGVIMLASGIYFFKAPNGFALGGISGLSIVLAQVLPFSQAAIMAVINVLLLIVGVIVLGKECGILTVYCSLAISGLNWLFESLVPVSSLPLTVHPELELVYAVLLGGIGGAIVFKCNASSGGTDIVALIIKKYFHINVGQALLIADSLIAFSTFFIYGIQIGLFSMLGLFAKVFVIDDFIESLNMCKAFTIITTKPAEIDEFIVNDMKHSATIYSAEGAFTGEGKTVIMTVCRRSEALRLRRRVKEIDPHSFIIITKTSEIMGKGFHDISA